MQESGLNHQRVLIIGLGMSGRSAAHFLINAGAVVTGIDRNPEISTHSEMALLIKKGLQILPENSVENLFPFDLVVLSPGIPFSHPLVQKAAQMNIEVIGEIELGCRGRKNPMLAITGTNGKTTVTLLTTHVLNSVGRPAKALGNVGTPFTQEIPSLDPETIVVLELSSYQLETMKQRVFDGAVLLNITPDHLDRYGTMEDYAAAKCRLRNCLKAGAPLYVEFRTMRAYDHLLPNVDTLGYGYLPSLPIYTDLENVYVKGQKAFSLPESLRGRPGHDLENLMGAYALCSIKGVSGKEFVEAFMTFKKPAHRIELVLEHEGIQYIDDSKGTNIDAVIRAVESLRGPIVLIAGGVDKGSSYTPWLKDFNGKVKKIFAIGQAAEKMAAELGNEIPVEIIKDLEQAVCRASEDAKKGDQVLLSPGCSSYDMFKDYAQRGEVFQGAVRRLAGKK